MDRGFLVVNIESAPKELQVGKDIFTRPMPWMIWFKAVFALQKGAWRFVRVIGVNDLECHQLAVEDGRLMVDDAPFQIEQTSPIVVIQWVIESLYYGTSLKFWQWPMFQQKRK